MTFAPFGRFGFAAPLQAVALAVAAFVGLAGLALASPRAAEPAKASLAGLASPAIAAAVAVTADGSKTRFSVTLSRPVAAKGFVMERPDRVILDLPEVTFHLPNDAGREKAGVIQSFRYGLFAPGRSRVVIDLAQPALVSKVEVMPHPRDGSAVLNVELIRAEREAFRLSAAGSAEASGDRPLTAAADPGRDRRPVIMLDPGHGGVDPGAAVAGGGMFEKDIVFTFAERMKKRLEAGGRYRVLMTRDHDVFVPLGDRVRLARAAKADLFISIHADSIAGGAEVRGLTVYTGSERASDADSARLADRENRSDAVAGVDGGETADDVSDILQELTLRETRAFSHGFAGRLVNELDPVARLNKNPHRQAGFRVLRAHDTPSVLVELGYLSSRKDFDLLMSDEWRDRAIGAMAAAIDRFFSTRLATGSGVAKVP